MSRSQKDPGKRRRDQRYRATRNQTPHKRLWPKTVPFSEAEFYAFMFKCKLEGVKHPATKLRELALEWAGYNG